MSNLAKEHLLTAEQMAQFVTDGYLMVENLVPKELNDAIYAEQQAGTIPAYNYWKGSALLQQAFNLPQVQGVIRSLLGDQPTYDHSALHVVPPRRLQAQGWHGDSVIDTRTLGFDIQIFYFSHDAPKETGPTLVLPGSHLRRINTFSIGRYKNIVGQKQLVAKAGTMVFWHQGLWHCAQPNHTDQTRYVFKLRLRPGQPQRALFNTEGYDSPAVERIISTHFAWQGNEGRLDHIQRAKLWRYVCGDDDLDFSFEGVLTRTAVPQ